MSNQLLEIAAGRMNGFDFKGAAISMLSQMAAIGVGTKLPGVLPTASTAVKAENAMMRRVVGTLTTNATQGVLTGRFNVEMLAAQLLGTEIAMGGFELAKSYSPALRHYVDTVDANRARRPQREESKAPMSSPASSFSAARPPGSSRTTSGDYLDSKLAIERQLGISDVALDMNDPRMSVRASAYLPDGSGSAEAAAFESSRTLARSTGPSSSSSTPFWRRAVTGGTEVFATTEKAGINRVREYAAQHLSSSIGFSIGLGLAVDVEVSVSKTGITMFYGAGVGIGLKFSVSGNYDLGDVSGFTSRTSANASLGPAQAGASVMVSQTGPAFSLSVQPGVGLEVESVVGYTETATWKEIRTYIQNRLRY